jgi:molybdopterin molybdotransferase
LISFERALQLIRQHAGLLPAERIMASEMLGRVLAEDIISPTALPSFDNAAMDGFALSHAHLRLAQGGKIEVRGMQAAGDTAVTLDEYACQIMTGAIVPNGAASIVPIEEVDIMDTCADGFAIVLKQQVVAGQHIRRAGEDVLHASPLFSAGTRLNSRHRMLCAALGIDTLMVRLRIKIAVFCTGNELHSDSIRKLSDGQIRNANGPYILAELAMLGLDVVHYQVIPDQQDAYLQALQMALQDGCQIIISTGAVSMGMRDFVPDVLRRMQAEIVFHKVRMRPAKPSLLAVLPTKTLVFGLPGNPMSCALGLRFFVQEAIRLLQGQPSEQPIAAVLQTAIKKRPEWQLMQKARLHINSCGQAQVSLLPGQESFRIKPFVDANVWAVLPEAATVLSIGDVIHCYPISASGLFV